MFHGRRHRGKLSPVQRDVQVDMRQQLRQQLHQRVNVGHAVVENLGLLFRAERPPLQNPASHGVLAPAAGRAQAEMAQRADQPLAFGGRIAAVEIGAKYRIEVEDVARQRPAERQVAETFGIGDKADEQGFVVEAVGRQFQPAGLAVPPQANGLPAAQLSRTQADHVRELARLRDVLEVGEPDLFEWQVSHGHGRPTS